MALWVWRFGPVGLVEVGGIPSDRDFPDVKVLKMLKVVRSFWKNWHFGDEFWDAKTPNPLADQGLACRFLEPQNVMSSWWWGLHPWRGFLHPRRQCLFGSQHEHRKNHPFSSVIFVYFGKFHPHHTWLTLSLIREVDELPDEIGFFRIGFKIWCQLPPRLLDRLKGF